MRKQSIIFYQYLIINTIFTTFCLAKSSTALDYLPRGSSIKVKDATSKYLMSPDKTFTCGFYTFNATTNAYYFAIWFTNSKERTLVWTANGDRPVNGHGSRLTLRKDGALALTDRDGALVWQTNTSSTAVSSAELLDSGNLILTDSNDNKWTCYTKGDLFNGQRGGGRGSLYIRVPNGKAQTLGPKYIFNVTRLQCGSGRDPKTILLSKTYHAPSDRRFKWVEVYAFGGAIGAIEVIIFVAGWVFLFRKHGMTASLEEGYRTISTHFRSFSYNELKKATSKFKQVLGSGGFGAVYKGVLEDERVIAVKKLENIVQGEEEFWAEVSTFGTINHMNLARMWGFCSEGKHRLLVYEYIENGSLDKHLFSSSSTHLDWEKRFKIAFGTARGLAYLHHECLEWVVHCDVKPENILLDTDFEPKISDFGLAKLCQRDSHHESTNLSKMRGTKGYMAPEWTTILPLTAKVDVYSYGVVILELVIGSRLSRYVVDENNVREEKMMLELKSFVRLAQEKMVQDGGGGGDDSWMEDLVDSRLERNFNRKQAAKMIEIGVSCLEDDRNKRPTMESVAQALGECEDENI